MADDFLKAIAELNTVALAFDGSGPYVAAELDKNVIRFATKVETNAKAIVPVKSGDTQKSIGTDITRDGSGAGITTTAVIGPTTEYAPYIELGTSRMAPRAFLGPSLDRYSGDFVAACEAVAIPPELA